MATPGNGRIQTQECFCSQVPLVAAFFSRLILFAAAACFCLLPVIVAVFSHRMIMLVAALQRETGHGFVMGLRVRVISGSREESQEGQGGVVGSFMVGIRGRIKSKVGPVQRF